MEKLSPSGIKANIAYAQAMQHKSALEYQKWLLEETKLISMRIKK